MTSQPGAAAALAAVFWVIGSASAQYIEQKAGTAPAQIPLTEKIAIPGEAPGYTLILPDDRKADGLIVVFQSDRDTVSKIFRYAISKRLGVLSVTTGNKLDFFFEDAKMAEIESYLEEVVQKHKIAKENLLFLGMSLAGTRALRFAQYSVARRNDGHLLNSNGFVPRCIAVVDAPLDFVRFWREMDKAKRIKATSVTANEGEWVSETLERNLGGTPDDTLEAYLRYSVYSHTRVDTARLRGLANVRIWAYTEPDVGWWMSTRKKDYYGMNAIDLAAFINDLTIAGNPHARLIVTRDRGYLPDGTRHPHSWSILDETAVVDWFLSSLK